MPTKEEKAKTLEEIVLNAVTAINIQIRLYGRNMTGNEISEFITKEVKDWHESELAKQRGEIVNQINEIDIKEMNVINTQVLHRPKDLYLLGRNAGHQNLVKKIVSNIHQKGGEDE